LSEVKAEALILPLKGEGWAPVAEGDWEDGVFEAGREDSTAAS
jgi:hypothetical protein